MTAIQQHMAQDTVREPQGQGAPALAVPTNVVVTPSAIPYAERSYWDSRYSKQPLSFDWFYGWVALRRVIRAHLPKHKQLLQIGCGNSTLQEGMAAAGYRITNVDISTVVVEQMRSAHAGVAGLEYQVGDARDMTTLFPTCTFYGALEKGTIDALLCCKEGADNVNRMCSEIARVLRPGCSFLTISLGEPAQRLPLLCRPQFDWQVSVLLLPRVPPDKMVQAPGRLLPVNDTLVPVDAIGPLQVTSDHGTHSVEGLPQPFNPAGYFYVYVCRKTPLILQANSKGKGQLPESWRSAVQESLAKLQAEMGLQADLFKPGVRRRTMRMSTFLAQQQQQQRQQQQAAAQLQHSRSMAHLRQQHNSADTTTSRSPHHVLPLHQQPRQQGGCSSSAGDESSSGTTSSAASQQLPPPMRRSMSMPDDGMLYYLSHMIGVGDTHTHSQQGPGAQATSCEPPVSISGRPAECCDLQAQIRYSECHQARTACSGSGAVHVPQAHPAAATAAAAPTRCTAGGVAGRQAIDDNNAAVHIRPAPSHPWGSGGSDACSSTAACTAVSTSSIAGITQQLEACTCKSDTAATGGVCGTGGGHTSQ